jgi:PAS domain S-box-containing protein
LHCTGNDAVGQPVEAWVRFEHALDDARALVMSALDQGRVVGVRHARLLTNRPGAAPIPVDESAGPIHDEQGRRLGAVLVLRDVSERLRQEALLRSSDERFRNAFEFAPLGMALVALDGRHLQVNGALCRLLERTPAALLACSQSELAVPEDVAHEQARLLELHAESAAVTQFEKRFLRPDGAEPVCTLIHASLLRHDDEPTCYLYQVHDLSAQKAAAVRLAELAAERIRREASELADRSKSEFLSRVSHEMRTPLNAVLGFAQLLQLEEARGRVAASGYPEHILQAGTHLLALVDDVLDLQRAADGALRLRMGPVGLDEALPAAVALLGPMAEARQVRLELALAPRLSVQADPTRLRQIVLNLGSNAIKYNVHGGSVRFTADEAPSGRIRLAVEDTGIGMSETQREHLFEPFNRLGREGSKVEGVGLGLVITRKLVEQMGASLQMSSHPETGTRVVLEFARAEEGA